MYHSNVRGASLRTYHKISIADALQTLAQPALTPHTHQAWLYLTISLVLSGCAPVR